MNNRRRFERFRPKPDKPVRVDINGENFLDILNAYDIAEGGIGFHADHPFAGRSIERPVHLVIGLPRPVDALLSAEGKIRYADGRGFGIEFGILPPAVRLALREYLHCGNNMVVTAG